MSQETEQPQLIWQKLKSSRAEGGVVDQPWNVHRTKVPGGWLVLVMHNTSGISFYPDPGHRWNGGSLTTISEERTASDAKPATFDIAPPPSGRLAC